MPLGRCDAKSIAPIRFVRLIVLLFICHETKLAKAFIQMDVLESHCCVPSIQLHDEQIHDLTTEATHCSCGLTTRQCAVANLYRLGYRNKEIASELGIAEQTVKNHARDIRSRLGIRSVGQIAARCALTRASSGLVTDV